MKIIFSRKGFDKKNGGVASPIFEGGELCSLPIPAPWDEKLPPSPRYRVRYRDLSYGSVSLGSVVEDLTFMPSKGRPRLTGRAFCHLDPDLIRSDIHRKAGWLPMFGQGNAACAHLFNNGITEGDLFLFFGWFHRVRRNVDRFEFVPDAPDVHVVFGWLQVGEIWCEFGKEPALPHWAEYHSHVRGDTEYRCNPRKPIDAVFIAKRRLGLPGLRTKLLGGGIFEEYDERLRLTAPGHGRRVWRLPAWMYPFPNKPPLTYHEDRKRWKRDRRGVLLRTVDIGQEFVLDADYYPRAMQWVAELFRAAE